jgi:DNA-binding transcriptional LysR family regulator
VSRARRHQTAPPVPLPTPLRRRNVALEELISEPWVLPPYDSVPGSLILQIFKASRLQPPQPSIVTLSGQLTVTLTASGLFVGVSPGSVAHFHRRAGLKILALKLPAVHSATSIVTVKNRTLSPSANLFIDCARQVIRPIASSIGSKDFKSV